MRRFIPLPAVLAVCSWVTVPPVLAGPPQSFDGWSVSNGNVAATCAAGLSCETLQGVGGGFLQRNIQDGVGQAYLQTIITAPTATGAPGGNLDFSDESFVRLGQSSDPAVNGIADKQTLKSQQAIGGATSLFDSVTLIQSGWAASAGVPLVDITQTLAERHPTDGDFDAIFSYQRSDNDSSVDITTDLHAPGKVQGDEFDSVFHYVSQGDGAGNRTGSRLAVSQSVGIAEKTSTLELGQGDTIQIPTVGVIEDDERQMFVIRRSEGVLAGGNDVLWMYHWQSTGLDPRQTMPLRGQWFGCVTTGSATDRCSSSSKHETFALPSLPFDPLPFSASNRIHSRDNDRDLYPRISGKDKGGEAMATPARQTGGNVIAATTPQTHGASAPPPPPSSLGSPVSLTNWSASNGTISAPCPAGHRCTNIAADDGFLQIEILDLTTGVTYYRTMMTDQGASGAATNLAFATDAVVRQSIGADQNLATGISAVTLVRDSSESMANITRMDLGWARSGERPGLDIQQSSPAGEFTYLANFNSQGERSGLRVDIDQINSDLTEKADTSFVYSAVGGDLLTQGGNAPLPGRATTSWKAGDYVATAYMSQKNVWRGGNDKGKDTGNQAIDLNQNWGGAATSFISFDNLSDSQARTGLISPKRSVDFLWQANPFGPLDSRFAIRNGK